MSSVPPIAFEDLPVRLAAVLRPRFERLGYLGEFFARAAHQPQALAAFHEFTESSKAALGQPLAELVALTCSTVLRNAYERNQHEHLSIALGQSPDWIAGAELDPAHRSELSPEEHEAQELVVALLADHGHGVAQAVEAYAAGHGPAATVALLLMVGRYLAHAVVVNALEVQPPVPSVFTELVDGD